MLILKFMAIHDYYAYRVLKWERRKGGENLVKGLSYNSITFANTNPENTTFPSISWAKGNPEAHYRAFRR